METIRSVLRYSMTLDDRNERASISQKRCIKKKDESVRVKDVLKKSVVVRFSGSVKGNPESESYGGVAQLGEHLPCKQGVKRSNLFISTKVGTNLGHHTGS